MIARSYHFGLLGQDIAYTLSPLIFDRLFALTAISSGSFSVHDVPPDRLSSEIRRLRELDGFSVTIPYKERIISHLDSLVGDAKKIGAANSVSVVKGRLTGYNTDLSGFAHPLASLSLTPKRILILGHGGSARAVCAALVRAYPQAAISVCGRDGDRARSFVDAISQGFDAGVSLKPMTFEAILDDDHFEMIVNCTPTGSLASVEKSPLPATFRFESCQVCYDLVYRPRPTLLLKQAAKQGCRTIDGLPMLVVQATESFSLWTGIKFDKFATAQSVINSVEKYLESPQ